MKLKVSIANYQSIKRFRITNPRAIQNMQIYFLLLEKFRIFYLLKKITIHGRITIKTTYALTNYKILKNYSE